MSTLGNRLDPKVLAEAAEWFALLGASQPNSADRERWQLWLAAHPDNRAAWERVENLTLKLEGLPEHAAGTLEQIDEDRRRSLQLLGLTVVSGLTAWGAWRTQLWQPWLARYRTAVGQNDELALEDGTRVWLNTATAFDVEYAAELRRLILHAGEIYVETAPDRLVPARHLVVDTAEGRSVALGTRFSVRQRREDSLVTVYDGAVMLRPSASPAAMRTLTPGQSASLFRDAVGSPTSVDGERASWTDGMLVVDNRRLADFAQELARYRHGWISCAPAVADLRLVGAFPVHDTDRILATLEQTLPIKVTRPLPGWVLLEAR